MVGGYRAGHMPWNSALLRLRGLTKAHSHGIAPRPIQELTADETQRARQTPCPECLGSAGQDTR